MLLERERETKTRLKMLSSDRESGEHDFFAHVTVHEYNGNTTSEVRSIS